MAVRQVLGAVGAVVGAYFGQPQLGFAIGSAIGGAVDPLIIRGPKLGDLVQQTAQEGVPRPIVFGLSSPMAGNVIASGNPRKVKVRKSQGKGGPKVETEHVYRTYAIGICEGPITRVVRVWRNGELVYSTQGIDELNIHQNHAFSILDIFVHLSKNNRRTKEHATFYLGDYAQEPNEDLEEDFGVGTTPAFRGTAYMVMANDDLTDLRGAIPQFTFQVERCEGAMLTSRPYPATAIDAMSVELSPAHGSQMQVEIDQMESTLEARGGEIYGGLVEYEDGEPEAMDGALESTGGDFFGGLVEYEDGEPEAMDSALESTGGDFFGDVVEYDEGEPEAMDVALEPLGGTLEAP